MLPSALIVAAYLVGAIPFGYLIARSRGVDLFKVGSGNIGATNVGRVLGRQYGIIVFVLDLLKGAVPVALVPVLLRSWPESSINDLQSFNLLRVGVALAAFFGHLFPVYLKFRGGKGVATGAGAVFVLVPGPAVIALLIWLAVVSSTRVVSLASIAAVLALCAARLIFVSSPFADGSFILTGFCLFAAAAVIVKHHANLRRLWQGTENQIEARTLMNCLSRGFHLTALALMLGSSVFFNLFVAPVIFKTFQEVAKSPAGDRTAYVTINGDLDDAKKGQLGNALAGAAVGPIFPLLFAVQGVCAVVALITALSWWNEPGRVNRWRVYVIGFALLTVAAGWPISQKVTELRLARFSTDSAVAESAKADFAVWHLYSLGLSFVTIAAALVATIMASKLPPEKVTSAAPT
jgi:acyl phosphate:glycerol-3-phosphate acyltransferase